MPSAVPGCHDAIHAPASSVCKNKLCLACCSLLNHSSLRHRCVAAAYCCLVWEQLPSKCVAPRFWAPTGHAIVARTLNASTYWPHFRWILAFQQEPPVRGHLTTMLLLRAAWFKGPRSRPSLPSHSRQRAAAPARAARCTPRGRAAAPPPAPASCHCPARKCSAGCT